MAIKVNAQDRLVRVKAVDVKRNVLVFKATFTSRRIPVEAVSEIKLERVSSLIDEIGLHVVAGKSYFLTDGISGFLKVAEFLSFHDKFGLDWHARAEAGESLVWVKGA